MGPSGPSRNIIEEILLACTENRPKVDINAAPLIFLRVSRRIRQVALGLPALWAGVTIEAPRVGRKLSNASVSVKLYLALIAEWLLIRSGALPLNIAISGKILDVAIDTHTKEQGILEILLRCKLRWQEMTIKTQTDLPLPLTAIDKAHLPHLRALTLIFKQDGDNGIPDFSDSGLLQARNLTRLRLWVGRHFALNRRVPLSWTKLTFLDISGSPMFLVSVLRQVSSCLVRLRMKFLCVTDTEEMVLGSEIIKLPHLKTLIIVEPFHPVILGLIDATLLKSFTYHNGSYYLPTECLLSFCSLITGLERLSINALHLDSIRSILRCTPALKELRIHGHGDRERNFANTFLDSFHTDDGERICSYLEVLYCKLKLYVDKATVDRFYESNPPKDCQLHIKIVVD